MGRAVRRLTSIVTTLGPASANEAVLGAFAERGVDVVRLNFAHGDYETHARTLAMVRKVWEDAGQFVSVLQDLAGPKLRLRTPGKASVSVARGGTVRMVRALASGDGPNTVATTLPAVVDDCREGEPVLLGDGAVRMRVVGRSADALTLEAEDEGTLIDGMGVNLPKTDLSVTSMTEKDWRDLEWAIAHEVDFVGLSFVRRAEEVRAVKDRIAAAGGSTRVIAKIEKPQALEQIDAILHEADGLMVARGDLGVEMDLARVPIIQKDLIRRAAAAGVPVITATQMLQSMITEPSPTRAEVSDVANAVFDGTDAVMLSGETAVGRHAVRAVEVMGHVIDLAEAYATKAEWPAPTDQADRYVWAERAIALGAARIAKDLGVSLVVALTRSGTTALLLSKQWLRVPILALSDRRETCRRMALYRGIVPAFHPHLIRNEDLACEIEEAALERKMIAAGDRILIISGQFPGQSGGTDTLRVHTVSCGGKGGAG